MSGTRKRNVQRDNLQLPTYVSKNKNGSKNKFRLQPVHFMFLLVGLCIGLIVTSAYDRWYRSRLVYTPFDSLIEHEDDMNKFWGTYRPQVYMGMKTKSPQSLVTGLMWLKQNKKFKGEPPMRHTCEQGDQILKYGWVAHDGVNFGIQDIAERGYMLRTEFVKRVNGDHGGDWTWRISGRQTGKEPITLSVFFYAATDGQGVIQPVVESGPNGLRLTKIQGETEELGKFTIKFPEENSGKKSRYHTATTKAEGLHKIKDAAFMQMQVRKEGPKGKENYLYYLTDAPSRIDSKKAKSDVIFHQVTLELPFEIDIVFESGSWTNRRSLLAGDVFTKHLTQLKDKFDKKFEATFPLSDKGYSQGEVDFAKAALSNMIGGIGYFYGQSVVQSVYQSAPVLNWDAPLLTAVPSRSFFPRGFLWDEGFHQLLISKWDRQLSEEVIMSWLNMVNLEGWIPREQILGDEARSKVPAEFVVQRNTNANPPTLFLAIESILQGFDKQSITERDRKFLKTIYPRLKAWFNWFNVTQSGPVQFSYRWRGRDAKTDSELNPKTLTSGLDDFPRASHPSDDERHIDLRCWMALAAGTMEKIAEVVHPGNSHEIEPYRQTHKILTDNNLLKELHWSADLGVFSDYGNHTDRVYLVKKDFPSSQPGQRPIIRTIRATRTKPKLQFVKNFGYVSLFPFLIQILKPDSQQLHQILQDLKGEDDLLWSNFGLRSLSKRDPLYRKRNTEHDPPYWRGQIWINMNFLAVRALKHYADTPGPYSKLAGELYAELRRNLVQNMYAEYVRTGYLWENYDDVTGKGQGSRPFTGWSALVVLIMSEQY
ncbi:mannosyl-oligosaccharide glucosidase-like [Clavelina lepadiformis]|uniref:mannosyl-oligosaccharide glucosidase-like n=1 Tax=Clavelina lepadiformis TaxID=159417 RepID=UPI0040430A7A